MSRDSVLFPVDVDTKSYMTAMKIISKEAFPESVAKTLNITADASTKQQIKNVKKNFTIRSNFTLKSMESRGARPFKALNKARGDNVDRMFSRTGTISRYLWMQENDFTKDGMNGNVPIPTLKARIGKNYKKTIKNIYRLGPNDTLSKRSLTFRNRKGDKRGGGFIGVPKGMNKMGLYLRGPRKDQLSMIRNLESPEVKIKGTGFHSKAVKKYGTEQFIAAQYKKEFLKMRKKRGVA